MIEIYTVLLLVAATVLIGACVLFFVLEQFRERTQGVVIRKEGEQHVYISRSMWVPIIKAMLGRHRLACRFEDASGQRVFTERRVSDELYFFAKPEEPIEVVYLKRYPQINSLVALLPVRFNEMLKLGGLVGLLWFIRIITASLIM